MHPRAVEIHEEGLPRLVLAVNEVEGSGQEFLVHRFHALARERASVLDLPIRVGVEHTAWPEAFTELRILGIVRVLWLFFGVQVIEVAEELVEAVVSRQERIFLSQVVLAELSGGVPQWLEEF